MNDVTFIMTWYGQPNHLYIQLEFFKQQGKKLDIKPKLIMINDGHEDRKYFERMIKAYKPHIHLTGIQLDKDHGFNSHMCRNIGVKQAKTDWIFLTDVDCHLSEELFGYIIAEAKLDDSMYYVPKANMEIKENMEEYELLDPKGIIKKVTHPNTWLMTRECFWSTGGYDIEFQNVRQGDAEFWLSIGRPGVKTWDYDLIHPEYTIFVRAPKREESYIRQENKKCMMAKELVEFVRVRNTNPYRKYRKRITNCTWDFV